MRQRGKAASRVVCVAVRWSLVSWTKMIAALSVRVSMSVIMCLCRLSPASSTASAEREVTLYVAVGREGIVEGRGFIAPRLGGLKLISSCLCL